VVGVSSPLSWYSLHYLMSGEKLFVRIMSAIDVPASICTAIRLLLSCPFSGRNAHL
jgi:hypothetical protein